MLFIVGYFDVLLASIVIKIKHLERIGHHILFYLIVQIAVSAETRRTVHF